MKFNIGNTTVDFNVERIRKEYPGKEAFFSDMISAHGMIEEKDFKKVLERVWKEAFPKNEKTEVNPEEKESL
ncbi:MAG: hypothetical protein FWF53_04470 [Candidatus Azobacteroides sp.]|nr:hypothetical protein [Candidatus Azobacteroides sp.]